MNVEDKCIVSVHFTVTGDDGKVLDSTLEQDPLAYLHGSDSFLPGLEAVLAGKTVGDQIQVTLQPDEAFGEVNPDLIGTMPIESFEGIEGLEPGVTVAATTPDGQMIEVNVEEINDEGVVINANHPFAGKVLHFDVTVTDIREATEEEIAHGHPHHGDGDCCH